jgi:hypothetical protein
MLSGSCHCGAVRVTIPRPPAEVTNCNCSLCRRVGALWAYFGSSEVQVRGDPEHTESYIQGDRMLRTIRCRNCGNVTHWEPLPFDRTKSERMGVNMRMFDPAEAGPFRIRLLDGADTWRSWYWEDLTGPTASGAGAALAATPA